MQSIFIGSTGAEPGQTLATWALAVQLQKKGLKVGFFKPYGLLPATGPSPEGTSCDGDVLLLKEVLNLSQSGETLCPVMMTENLVREVSENQGEMLVEKIKGAFEEISRGKDVLLIMGGKEIFFGGGLSGLSDSLLVKLFNASVLLVDRYQKDNLTLYSLLSLNSFLDGRVKSAILNHVAPEKMDHVKTKIIPFLQGKGVQSIVAVPENPILAALTVFTITELIDGKILCCPEGEGNLIGSTTIGSKYLDGSLSLFKQVYNKILLLGLGEAIQKGKAIGGIILTGGKMPGEGVLQVAREQGIPLILTRADSFQTMERMEKAKPSLGVKDEFKVLHFLKLIEQENGPAPWVEALL